MRLVLFLINVGLLLEVDLPSNQMDIFLSKVSKFLLFGIESMMQKDGVLVREVHLVEIIHVELPHE